MAAPPVVGQGRENDFEETRMGVSHPYWSQFLHPWSGYEFPVPPGMRAVGEPADSPETTFVSTDGSFVISAWGGQSTPAPASLLDEEWRAAMQRPGRSINYRRRAASWFVVSGTERDGTEFYEKFLSRGNQVAAFSLKYPRSRLREFEPWVEKIEDNFRIVTTSSKIPVSASRNGPATTRTTPRLREQENSTNSIARPPAPSASPRNEERPPTNPLQRPKAQAKPTSTQKAPVPDLEKLTPEKEPVAARNFTTKEIPVGSKVPGRPGFVYSPHTSDKSLVDVVGIPSGTKVKCPYSNKVFRVP